MNIACVTNDIFTREDAEVSFAQRLRALMAFCSSCRETMRCLMIVSKPSRRDHVLMLLFVKISRLIWLLLRNCMPNSTRSCFWLKAAVIILQLIIRESLRITSFTSLMSLAVTRSLARCVWLDFIRVRLISAIGRTWNHPVWSTHRQQDWFGFYCWCWPWCNGSRRSQDAFWWTHYLCPGKEQCRSWRDYPAHSWIQTEGPFFFPGLVNSF